MSNYKQYINELGDKLKTYRIEKGMTQQELADSCGVSKRSISRLEQGESVQTDNLFKILITLGLGENIKLLVPDQSKRPSYYLNEKKPRRARKKTKPKPTFKWGDEA